MHNKKIQEDKLYLHFDNGVYNVTTDVRSFYAENIKSNAKVDCIYFKFGRE